MNKHTSNKAAQAAQQANTLAAFPGGAHTRPIRQLFRQLPLLAQGMETPTGLDANRPGALVILADSAERSMRTIHLGLAALGQLVARSSLDIEDGTVSAESMENLGFLMAELGDLAAECMRIANECRSATSASKGAANALGL